MKLKGDSKNIHTFFGVFSEHMCNNFSFPIEMDEPDYFETPRYGNQNVLVKKKEEELCKYQ